MTNARSAKAWFLEQGGLDIARHFVALTTNISAAKEFGIDTTFGFWDWVGGRYSVWSAVGVLPLSLVFTLDVIEQVLDGAHSADNHFFNTEVEHNIPIHMALITIDHVNRGFKSRAILPYSQALERFPAHIQQVEMESNGKYINENGERIEKSGQVVFGEPGTNGQHSFYQLLHQGTQIVPCEFIGFCDQPDIDCCRHRSYFGQDTDLTNHDVLMCNFFAQANALFYGKNENEVLAEGCPEQLVAHKTFEGGRPSTLLLFKEYNNYNLGFLLALYEHYVAAQGFYWGINSFDQYGVELGKQLANKVKSYMEGDNSVKFNNSTQSMLDYYMKCKKT